MEFKDKLARFSELVIKVGVNLQSGEELYISSPVACADVARSMAEVAYKSGAKDVIIIYDDELFAKIRITNTDTETLCNIPEWQKKMRDTIAEKKACYIAIASDDPELFSDVSADKMAAYSKAKHQSFAKFYDASMSNNIKWCVASAPSPSWAKSIFPNLSETEAISSLWELIFKSMRVYEDNPVSAWNNHNQRLIKYCEFLNKNEFVSMHYKNSIGTDFTVGLPKNYVFTGGLENSAWGCPFTANMPTEEVFSAPHKYSANGTLVSSMPLCHMGKLIKNFSLTFKNGEVTAFSAETGYDTLKCIIDTDNGSKYLGEIALIGYDTPIQNLKTLFLNTLFDENASCHFALGKAYPTCVKGTENLSEKELDAIGVNNSLEHVDFMVGTSDLSIVATKADGSKVQIFKDGNFVI
ncbi:MAG: aminopeptidase [Clostridia bacterium]